MMTASAPFSSSGLSRSHRSTPRKVTSGPNMPPTRGMAQNYESDMTIEKIAFGRTGHQSTRLLFGAAALGSVDQATADHTLDLLLRHGINHIDVARSYGDAELRIAPWLKQGRDRFFLATK